MVFDHPVRQPVADALAFVLIMIHAPEPLAVIVGQPALTRGAGVNRVLHRKDQAAAGLERALNPGE
jgi:hypothetical protein